MAAAGHDVNEQDLNFVFKCLGEQGREAVLFKEFNELVFVRLLEQVSESLSSFTENQVTVRRYGSAAEDLQCLSPDDYGDMDIMVFPSSDSLMIYDEMLKYLSENPLHVRIKASDHPVLQSCLVEGTEYVATSALKNFHPAIYGSFSPQVIAYFKHCLGIFARDDRTLQCAVNWTNKKTSPAFTINFKQTFDTSLKALQKMTESKSMHYLDSPEWEWFGSLLPCMTTGVEYTREHAKDIKENELQASLAKDGTDGFLQGVPRFLQQIMYSDAIQNVRALFLPVEHRSQNESESPEEAICHDNLSVTPQTCDAGEGGSSTESSDNGPCVTPQNSDDAHLSQNQVLESTSFHSMETARSSDESVAKELNEREDADETAGDTTKRDRKEIGNESQSDLKTSSEKEELASEDGTLGETGKTDEKFDIKRFVNHLFELETEIKEHPEKKEEEEEEEYKRKIGIDLVPALRSRGWPKTAREWLKRERKWPSGDMVHKIIQEGFHLVVKPPKNSANPDCEFRVSFSHAEYLLSQEMNDIQRECYRCLKKFHRAHLSNPPGLVTFHLKNLLLQTIEETGVEKWTDSNRAECMMKLLGNLLEALRKKHLSHFFVRSYNMFGVDYIENPENLASFAEKVENIIENPMAFSKELIRQNQEDAKQIEKEETEQDSEPAVSAISESKYGHQRATEPRGDSGNQRNKESLADAVLHSTQESGSLLQNYRYHDLQDIYFQVVKELIDKAFNSEETQDPLERSLVDDLREIISCHNLQAEEVRKKFKCFWKMAFLRICLNTERDMRRRMLDAIHGDVQIWKYLLRQEDFAAGNEVAIINRMLDPSAEDPFDFNHIIPSGGGTQMIRMFFMGLFQHTAQPEHAQANHDVDDIPLD